MPKTIKINNSTIFILPEASVFSNQIQTNWFDAEYWHRNNKIVGESIGRNTTWFIDPSNELADQSNGEQWVLRHYYRGGLAAKLTADRFLFTHIKKTRAYREISLLSAMKSMGLPVPAIVAARVIRWGLFYSADLIMEKVEGSDLVTLLKEKPLSEKTWGAIGATIAQFHKNGIYHADLNTHNILIQETKTGIKNWLIDFDRCKQRNLDGTISGHSWQKKNLARLYRSLVKEKKLDSALNFEDQKWSELLKGYNATNIDSA